MLIILGLPVGVVLITPGVSALFKVAVGVGNDIFFGKAGDDGKDVAAPGGSLILSLSVGFIIIS